MVVSNLADRSTYEFRGKNLARSSVTISQQSDWSYQLGRSGYLLVGCLCRQRLHSTEIVANVVMPILVSIEQEINLAATTLILAFFVDYLSYLLANGDETGIYWQSFNLTPIPIETSMVPDPDKKPFYAVCRTEL